MKKLVLVVAALTMASFSQAALLLCATNVNTISGGVISNPSNVNCGSIDAGAGNLITDVAIRLLGSFNDAIENTNHQLQFDGTHNLTAAVHTLQTNIGDLSGNGGPSAGVGVAVGTQTLGASTVAVTTSSVGGLNAPQNASISVWLSYNVAPVPPPPSGVPEPGTLALLGSALIGVGLVSRRK